jgi:uncharacterized protein GlcG (DUF336 family)
MAASKAVTVRTVTAEFARELIEAGERKSVEISVPMVIAVTDRDGVLKAFLRMDGAPLLSVRLAQDKAYTAAAFGLSTDGWHEFIKDDEPLRLGIPPTEGVVTFGGGYPIMLDGELIGGIGASGGHYTEDMQVASAALESGGLSPS